jgi:hypothetical protein
MELAYCIASSASQEGAMKALRTQKSLRGGLRSFNTAYALADFPRNTE